MKKLIITMCLTLVASSQVAAAIETFSEQDLMNHYVSELESKVGQSIDLYDGDAVSEAIREHHLYLMLCSNKVATDKCNQAKDDLSKLNSAQTVHLKFQNDLAAMWKVNNSLKQTKSDK